MTVTQPNGAHKDVDDLYGDRFTVALAQAMTRLECAPYWHSGEKAPARLVRAGELVRLSRVQLHDERTATVHGSTKPYDITGYHCTCPQSQKGQTHWCVHAVAVKLARTMAEQAPRPTASDDDEPLESGYPIDDETLPLPIGPTNVEERLAQAAASASDHVYDPLPVPEEDRMTEDEVSYIPEPDEAPVTVLEPLAPRPLPGPVLLPSLDARTLEQSMQAWSAQRQVVTRYIKEQMAEGVDYYTLTIKGRVSKATLSKAGSEKFLSLFQLHASFAQDAATWQMLGSKEGLLCYTCTLLTRAGEVVGEGRGARSIQQDGGDINKAIKMATKSAQVDAVLRTGALSDVFTQDVTEAEGEEGHRARPPAPPAQAQAPARPAAQDPVSRTAQALRARIWARVQALAPEVRTRQDIEVWIQQETGYPLHPEHFEHILASLEVR
jgi:hypothetical protein